MLNVQTMAELGLKPELLDTGCVGTSSPETYIHWWTGICITLVWCMEV